AIGSGKEREKKAVAARREGGGPGMGPFSVAFDLENFVAKRRTSIQNQLAGKSKGTVPAFGFGPPGGFGPGQFLVKPILAAGDKDKDRKLSREELLAAAKALFKALDKEGKGELDHKAVGDGLNKLLPRPGGFPVPGGR